MNSVLDRLVNGIDETAPKTIERHTNTEERPRGGRFGALMALLMSLTA